MKLTSTQKNRGFTIVEMLVAVFIFTLSLAALMTIASRGLKIANQAQKQVVGEYLGLEAIEGVRNIRDAAFIRFDTTTSWRQVFDQDNCLSQQYAGDNNGCELGNVGGSLTLKPCNQCRVKYSETGYSYRQGDSSATYLDSPYTRHIELTQVENTSEIIVTVTVAWDGGKVVYTEDLFLWLL